MIQFASFQGEYLVTLHWPHTQPSALSLIFPGDGYCSFPMRVTHLPGFAWRFSLKYVFLLHNSL